MLCGLLLSADVLRIGIVFASGVLHALHFLRPHWPQLCHDLSTGTLSPAVVTDPSLREAMLCGLLLSADVLRIGVVFASGVLRALRFLRLHWPQLCHDLSTGTLSLAVVTDPSLREASESSWIRTSPTFCPEREQESEQHLAQMLCGLLLSADVLRIGVVFASGVLRALCFLRLHWPQLCHDLSTGTLSPAVVTDPSLREAVGELLDQNKLLINEINQNHESRTPTISAGMLA
uniref:Uncharacterized protein n=1 Tax=Ananas comosus var. bracteatus TaxID=296719 RepID=A0A6V7QHU1_ANACO|nr:unnamed protein product [Ananas comosus var. bracteatus]